MAAAVAVVCVASRKPRVRCKEGVATVVVEHFNIRSSLDHTHPMDMKKDNRQTVTDMAPMSPIPIDLEAGGQFFSQFVTEQTQQLVNQHSGVGVDTEQRLCRFAGPVTPVCLQS